MTKRELLDTKLSPDKVSDYTPNELALLLIEEDLVKTISDVNKIIIEGIQKALEADDEFPIHYYTKEEQIPEESRAVEGEYLTDDFIANLL